MTVKSGCCQKAPPDVSLPELSCYELVKEQLTHTDIVLLKSDRLVVPAVLQERIIDIAHEGHLGIVNTNAVVPMQGQNGGNEDQGLLTVSRWFLYLAVGVVACVPLGPLEVCQRGFHAPGRFNHAGQV